MDRQSVKGMACGKHRHPAAILSFSESRGRLKMTYCWARCYWNYFESVKCVVLREALRHLLKQTSTQRNEGDCMRKLNESGDITEKDAKKDFFFFIMSIFWHSQIFRPWSLITHSLSRKIRNAVKQHMILTCLHPWPVHPVQLHGL